MFIFFILAAPTLVVSPCQEESSGWFEDFRDKCTGSIIMLSVDDLVPKEF